MALGWLLGAVPASFFLGSRLHTGTCMCPVLFIGTCLQVGREKWVTQVVVVGPSQEMFTPCFLALERGGWAISATPFPPPSRPRVLAGGHINGLLLCDSSCLSLAGVPCLIWQDCSPRQRSLEERFTYIEQSETLRSPHFSSSDSKMNAINKISV